MPRIYLSPSTQENNLYVNGGTEEYYMNLVADAAVPYLDSSGILYTRNTPDMTAAESIAQANAGTYELYVAIHSNAAPPGKYGTVRGSLVFYYPTSQPSTRASQIFVRNAKQIYPLPELVRAVPTTSLGEVTKTRAPAVLWETAYHDNVEDANWIKANIPNIGWAVAASTAEFFGLPLAEPSEPLDGTVNVRWGTLNIRRRPNTSAQVIASAQNGAPIVVLGDVGEWYVVRYGSVTGYAFKQFVEL